MLREQISYKKLLSILQFSLLVHKCSRFIKAKLRNAYISYLNTYTFNFFLNESSFSSWISY